MSVTALVVTAVLTQNVILAQFLAPWPFPALLATPRRGALVSLALTVVFVWSATLYGIVYRTVLAPFGLVYLETITLVVILSVSLMLAARLAVALAPARYRLVRSTAPVLFLNAAVFVVATRLPQQVDRFAHLPLAAAATGAGVFLALVPLAAIRHRLDRARLPRALRGDTAVYIAVALTALVVQRLDAAIAALL